jgi:DNA repair protein RecN (Recombination protein N)
VLLELRIRNFAIIEELDLQLSPGLNILTGETGAGKSIIIDALGVLLGDKADRTMVRTGAERAEVEGVIALDERTSDLLQPLFQEYGLSGEDDENLILYRDVGASGRSVGRVNGRAVNVYLLREIGERLVDIHGQSEHLSLFRVRHHLDMLDRYAGTQPLRQELAVGVARLRGVQDEIARLEGEKTRLAERTEVLRFRLQEIDAAELKPGEEDELRLERQRLQNGAHLLASLDRLHALLHGGETRSSRAMTGGVLDLLGQAAHQVQVLAQMDPLLVPQQSAIGLICEQVEDLNRALRAYRDRLDLDPRRLQEVEDRLVLIRELERKYGPSVEEVLAAAVRAREELEGLSQSGERLEELRQERERMQHSLGELAGRLSLRRREYADQMADLNMAGTTFAVQIERKQDPEGLWLAGELPCAPGRYAYDATGVDRVEFLISPNPGEELRPLIRVASGGESSRLLLAIKSVLSQADATPVLIFDEIDVGVGGRSGHVVGEKLWELSQHHQVLCITHLPQIAAYADSHFTVGKTVEAGRTTTQAARLEGEALIEELAVMLGGPVVSPSYRESAREIWDQARQKKAGKEG